MAGGESGEQVSDLLCAIAGDDEGDWDEARRLINQANELLPDEPMIVELRGRAACADGAKRRGARLRDASVFESENIRACASYVLSDRVHSRADRAAAAGLRVVGAQRGDGIACWPFFMKDPCLQNLRGMSEFELLVSTLQAKYPDNLGVL